MFKAILLIFTFIPETLYLYFSKSANSRAKKEYPGLIGWYLAWTQKQYDRLSGKNPKDEDETN